MCCREIFSASVREMSEPILFSLDITSVMLSPRWGHALCFCIVRLCVCMPGQRHSLACRQLPASIWLLPSIVQLSQDGHNLKRALLLKSSLTDDLLEYWCKLDSHKPLSLVLFICKHATFYMAR